MTGGGWMHCGTHVSGWNMWVAQGMVNTISHGGATDLARRSSAYSVDCRFALVPSAQVAFSDSGWPPGAGVRRCAHNVHTARHKRNRDGARRRGTHHDVRADAGDDVRCRGDDHGRVAGGVGLQLAAPQQLAVHGGHGGNELGDGTTSRGGELNAGRQPQSTAGVPTENHDGRLATGGGLKTPPTARTLQRLVGA